MRGRPLDGKGLASSPVAWRDVAMAPRSKAPSPSLDVARSIMVPRRRRLHSEWTTGAAGRGVRCGEFRASAYTFDLSARRHARGAPCLSNGGVRGDSRGCWRVGGAGARPAAAGHYYCFYPYNPYSHRATVPILHEVRPLFARSFCPSFPFLHEVRPFLARSSSLFCTNAEGPVGLAEAPRRGRKTAASGDRKKSQFSAKSEKHAS